MPHTRATISDNLSVERFRLSNGLTVVSLPNYRAPVVTHMLWYKNGSADDPAHKSGLAHFLEHLMFKGTEKRSAEVFATLVAELGGEQNAFTSNDYTAYYQRIEKKSLPVMMDLEADRMVNLALRDADVDSERLVILEERQMRVDNDPISQLYEKMSEALFSPHPYARPIIGWREDIEKLELSDLLAYYKRFYVPENAILIVAGDVKPEDVEKYAQKAYGAIPALPAPTRERKPADAAELPNDPIIFKDVKVEQPALLRFYRVPSYATNAHDAYALDVLNGLLTSSTGILYQRLVLEGGVALETSSYYQDRASSETALIFYVIPTKNLTLPELEKAFDDAIEDILAKGISEEDVRRVKTRFIADSVYNRDSQFSLAQIFGSALCTGAEIDEILHWPDRIAEVTAQDVTRVARTYFTDTKKRRVVTGYLSPL